MQVDYLTLACLRDHFDSLLGARVQQVVLPDDRSVGLELYAGRRLYLLASTHPQAPYCLIAPEKSRRGVETATPLLLLLRKWVRGSRLVDVTQPPWERILILHFSGRAGECRLVVELIGRYSNFILVGPDGCVLEALKHVGARVNRYRTTLPSHPYQPPPPPPNRLSPLGLDPADWAGRLGQANADEPLHRWLVSRFRGISPMLAHEIAARATGHPGGAAQLARPELLHRAVEDLFAPQRDGWWSPHVALDDRGSVIAFAAYEPRQFDRVEPVSDISQAMWRYFQARGLDDSYAASRQAVQALIDDVTQRLSRRADKLQEQVVDEEDAETLRVAGELLLTYQHNVSVASREVTLLDHDGDPRTITLNPKLTAVENAQAYFRRYEKTRRALKQVPALIEDLRIERAYLEQLDVDLALAESRPEIDAVRDSLSAAGWIRKRSRGKATVSEPRRIEVAGFSILVGRSARQNEIITFRRAGPDDLWLHVQGLPGAHVVIKAGRQAVPDEVIERAAQIAAYYSRARDGESNVPVDVTKRRFVRRRRGKCPGMVTYRNERTIWVRAVSEDLAY